MLIHHHNQVYSKFHHRKFYLYWNLEEAYGYVRFSKANIWFLIIIRSLFETFFDHKYVKLKYEYILDLNNL